MPARHRFWRHAAPDGSQVICDADEHSCDHEGWTHVPIARLPGRFEKALEDGSVVLDEPLKRHSLEEGRLAAMSRAERQDEAIGKALGRLRAEQAGGGRP